MTPKTALNLADHERNVWEGFIAKGIAARAAAHVLGDLHRATKAVQP